MTIRYYIDPETGLPHIYGHAWIRKKWKRSCERLGKIAQVEKDLEWRSGKREPDAICE